MFAGHYAAALAAKAAEPRAPLWTLIAGAQLVDIGWAALVIAGIETGSVDPALPGSALVLSHMPWTHSLAAALVWAIAAALLSKTLLRLSLRTAIVIGAVVFSHWLLDLIVHRPDLELYPNGPSSALACGIRSAGTGGRDRPPRHSRNVLGRTTRTRGLAAWSAAAFFALLVVVQIIAMLIPAEAADTIQGTGPSALAVYIVLPGRHLPGRARVSSVAQFTKRSP